jgi:hypothetical protein
MSIILYRAMCNKEADKTLYYQSLQYYRNKEKCFSPYLDWIKSRVQDGRFNNSYIKQDRYSRLLEFIICTSSLKEFIQCRHEWKTNSRKIIKVLQVKEI